MLRKELVPIAKELRTLANTLNVQLGWEVLGDKGSNIPANPAEVLDATLKIRAEAAASGRVEDMEKAENLLVQLGNSTTDGEQTLNQSHILDYHHSLIDYSMAIQT